MRPVAVFGLTERRDSRLRWQVRWRCRGRYRSKQFVNKAQAERFRAGLVLAADRGDPFDRATGLPASKEPPASDRTVYQVAVDFVARKWSDWAPKSRQSAIETYIQTILLLTDESVPATRLEDLKAFLRSHAFRGHTFEAVADVKERRDFALAHDWLIHHSLRWKDVDLETIEDLLNRFARRSDGRPCAASTINRRKSALTALLKEAVRRGSLESNPMDRIDWKAPRQDKDADATRVPNRVQAEALFAAVDTQGRAGPRLRAFFETMFWAGLRPGEVRGLKVEDIELPPPDSPSAFGLITVRRSVSVTSKNLTSTGEASEVRGLKWRSRRASRRVPIHPILVSSLRKHLQAYPPEDGWVFTNHAGRHWDSGRITAVWAGARKQVVAAGHDVKQCRPYDLRHANASMLLAAGCPAAEVAARLGHSTDMLLSTYASPIPGEEGRVNALIQSYLEAS